MSFAGGSPGLNAVQALIDAQGTFPAIADKDWATAAALIVKKLLTSAGQTAESLIALRTAVGASIFDTQLKTLSTSSNHWAQSRSECSPMWISRS